MAYSFLRAQNPLAFVFELLFWDYNMMTPPLPSLPLQTPHTLPLAHFQIHGIFFPFTVVM